MASPVSPVTPHVSSQSFYGTSNSPLSGRVSQLEGVDNGPRPLSGNYQSHGVEKSPSGNRPLSAAYSPVTPASPHPPFSDDVVVKGKAAIEAAIIILNGPPPINKQVYFAFLFFVNFTSSLRP
jgi:hypothetical protein